MTPRLNLIGRIVNAVAPGLIPWLQAKAEAAYQRQRAEHIESFRRSLMGRRGTRKPRT